MFYVGIVAHAIRATQARELARQVRAPLISVDDGMLGCEGNHRLVQTHLQALGAPWSIILEDDAEPICGFPHQAREALLASPTPIVSFYLGRSRPRHAQRKIAAALAAADERDAHWIVSTRLLHAVGYAIRTELLESLLCHDSELPADEHITAWARRHGHAIGYTVGSLVDHADGPTVVDHRDGQPRTPGRRAWRLGNPDRWTSQAVTMT